MKALTVIKVGGAVVEDNEALSAFLDDYVKYPGLKLLVHGGGRSATRMGEKLGIESRMVKGRRVTDAESLAVVTMVYGGLVNKNIVAQLQARGLNALGLTGADLNILEAGKRPPKDGIDWGWVGDVKKTNTNILANLIGQGISPVAAPLTHDGNGNMLNTNADTIASELAVGLSKHFSVKLIYCFEKKGVMADPDDENSLIREIRPNDFDPLRARGIIAGGMIAKLENCFAAIGRGVGEVMICHVGALAQAKPEGTVLRK
jgi:acetylglutamate kinase